MKSRAEDQLSGANAVLRKVIVARWADQPFAVRAAFDILSQPVRLWKDT